MKKMVALSLLGLFFAFVAAQFVQLQPKSPFAKHGVVNSEQRHVGAWLPGKPSSPIRIHLFSPRGIAHYGTENTEIQARVQFTRPMDRPVRFRWTLPPGAQIIQGQLTGEIPPMRPGELFKPSLTLTGIGIKELPRNVSLEV